MTLSFAIKSIIIYSRNKNKYIDYFVHNLFPEESFFYFIRIDISNKITWPWTSLLTLPYKPNQKAGGSFGKTAKSAGMSFVLGTLMYWVEMTLP